MATGCSDFSNQVNNPVCFPSTLKGILLVRTKRITDNMAIAASYSIANYAEKRGINPSDNIIPTVDETGVFPTEAADAAMAAIKDGVQWRMCRPPGRRPMIRQRRTLQSPTLLLLASPRTGRPRTFHQDKIQKVFEKALTEVKP